MVSKPARYRQLPVHPSPGLARPAGSLITGVFRSHRTNARFLEKLIRSIVANCGTKYVARKKVTLELRIPEGISLRGRCVRIPRNAAHDHAGSIGEALHGEAESLTRVFRRDRE